MVNLENIEVPVKKLLEPRNLAKKKLFQLAFFDYCKGKSKLLTKEKLGEFKSKIVGISVADFQGQCELAKKKGGKKF